MKINVSELTGVALDFAVSMCEEKGVGALSGEMLSLRISQGVRPLPYSTEWALGGPIIEREISKAYDMGIAIDKFIRQHGKNPLIGAMRCYVASKLGEYVDVPDELLEEKERS